MALIDRLRRAANGLEPFKTDRGDFGLAEDAADEIERLRFALGAIAGRHHWPDPRVGEKVFAASVLDRSE